MLHNIFLWSVGCMDSIKFYFYSRGLSPGIEHLVNGRAKIVYAPRTGAFESYRAAFVSMARDEINKLHLQALASIDRAIMRKLP